MGCARARVLSDHFERVTLIERDELPEGAAHRKGVPQSRHPHGLLDRGRRELSALFPGLDDSLHERGGLDMDAGLELATLNPDGWAKRRRTGHQMLFASRLLIESVIRDRVKKNPRIEFVEGTEVTALLFAPGDTSRVTGVETRKSQLITRSSRIEADLVVDCSGRSSRASEWLTRRWLSPNRGRGRRRAGRLQHLLVPGAARRSATLQLVVEGNFPRIPRPSRLARKTTMSR